MNISNYSHRTIQTMNAKIHRIGILATNRTLNHPKFQSFLQTDNEFDVIILMIMHTEALLVLGHHFNAPIIAMSPFGATKWTADLVGTPNQPSYIPHALSGYSDRMTFIERIRNFYISWYSEFIAIEYMARHQELLDKYFPIKSPPSIESLKRNVSLVLLNTHVTFGISRPYTPNMIEVGGLHIDSNVKALPENLQNFLDSANDGAIYFSLGSQAKFSRMSDEMKRGLLNGFTEYSNMKLLLKSDERFIVPSHSADDVLIQSWLPQQSILAHPNVKVFVTQGGILSQMETIYFGKPIVGIPMVSDQYLNMKLAKTKGYGEMIRFDEFDETKFKEMLRKALSDPR